MEANGPMLAQARETRKLQQADVARAMSDTLGEPVSQGYVSRAESGKVAVAGARLEAFSQVLGYPVPTLCEPPDPESAVGLIHHRKKASLGAPALRVIHANLSYQRRQVDRVLRTSGTRELGLFRLPASAEDSPADIAGILREKLGLGDGPLADLTAVVEDAGGVVLRRDLGTRELDAVSLWPEGAFPFFVVNDSAPADRMRFSLSHELGHVLMHEKPGATPVQEKEADQFASEFLMPAAGIRNSLRGGLDLATLEKLKLVWGVSMAALTRRARDLGVLSDWQYRNLVIEMSTLGYKLQEPVHIRPEFPSTVANVVSDLIHVRGMTVEQLAATAGLFPAEFEQLYLATSSQ
ncbi:ImmA/IrrE family metallo-endopeptidase [Longispora albida]|uniref:ImmA/IrrE family metallo-endopeptidase n=1 Tax=Longispora albida TaxID=203523 RepID=UPI0012FBF8FC|nr:XRE family transcriptional regulator [Longispora albida]